MSQTTQLERTDDDIVTADVGAAVPRTTGRGRSWRRTTMSPLLIASSVAVMGGLWMYFSGRYSTFIFPSPAETWTSFKDTVDRGVWQESILATFRHMLMAIGLIVAIGLPVGIVIGRSKIAEALSRVPLIFAQTLPTIVLIVFVLIFVGTTQTGVIAVTVLSGLPYFTLNVIQGTRSIDVELVEMSQVYGAPERTVMRQVVLPSVVPFFLAGLRITLGVVWQVTLFAEYLMGVQGVGFRVSTTIRLADTPSVFAWGLSIVVLTIAVEYGLFRPLERALTRHQRR